MNVQGEFHGEGFAYEPGSPHLSHGGLRRRIASSLRTAVQRSLAATGECRVLELGAGHGTFTDVLREAGASVVVTEMSPASAAVLRERFRGDAHVVVEDDPDGDWVFRTSSNFDLAVCISVLHHIPDYLRTVGRLVDVLSPAGSFVCWQDPTWYPGMRWSVRALSTGSYFAWRVGRGDLARGLATRLRRLRRRYEETDPADMAEYHVVRDGVDQEALARLLRLHFTTVTTVTYWSTQAAALQRLGDRLGVVNTFGMITTRTTEREAQPR